MVITKGLGMKLTDIVLKKINRVGRHTDEGTKGLHLWVKPTQQKYWIFRYTVNGKRHGTSLGAYPEVGLRQAREKATEARNAVNKGLSPAQKSKSAQQLQATNKTPTFSSFAFNYIETMRSQWRNEKHADQWVNTIKTYALPVIGEMPVNEIDTEHILQILNPIWLSKSETASRLRGRIERILSAAITRKYRPAVNPAMWKGHLENLMPPPKPSGRHHKALPYKQTPEFVVALQKMECLSALALEFTILNASRTNEVLQGLRSEIDGVVWTIPGNRMKGGKEHQAPLCQRSLDLLTVAKDLDPDSKYLFSKHGKPLSNMAMLRTAKRMVPGITVHGFRSTFRDWVSEEEVCTREVAEMALAHTIGSKVEKAYRRGNLLDRRRRLMKDWESYCLTGTWCNVVQFPERKAA